MLNRSRNRSNIVNNIRQIVHGRHRASVRHSRPDPNTDFALVQRHLANDYRQNQITRLRSTRSALLHPNRVWFDTTTVAQRGFVNISIFQRNPQDEHRDLSIYLHSLQPLLRQEILDYFRRWRGVGFKLGVRIIYANAHNSDEEYNQTVWSSSFYVLTARDLDKAIQDCLAEIETRSLLFFEEGSDKAIVRLDPPHRLRIWQQDRAPGIVGSGDLSRYLAGGKWIELPRWVMNKKACINFRNTDNNECFRYCLEYAWLVETKNPKADEPHPERYKWFDPENCTLDWSGVNFPMTFDDIDTFEAVNADKQICVRVLVPREDVNFSLSLVRDCTDLIASYENPVVVMLLLLADDETDNFHYVYVKGTEGILRIIRKHLPKTKGKMLMCLRCMRSFHSQIAIEHHKNYQCADNDYRMPELPEEEKSRKCFSSMSHFNASPFVIFYDFESANQKMQHEDNETKTQASKMSTQVPVSFGITAVCPTRPEFTILPYIYTTDKALREDEEYPVNRTNVMRKFHNWLIKHTEYFDGIINDHFRHPFSGVASLTFEQRQDFNEAEQCSMCLLSFNREAAMPHWCWKVLPRPEDSAAWSWAKQSLLNNFDPDHPKADRASELRQENLWYNQVKVHAHDPTKPDNNYTGAAHRICASEIGRYRQIPCIAHNSSRYDNHLVLQSFSPTKYRLTSMNKRNKLFDGISSDSDRYKSFTLNKTYTFLDSYAYLSAPLDNLVSNALKDGKHKLPFTREVLAQYIAANFSNSDGDETVMTEELEDLLLKKGVYPYEWLDCPTKLKSSGPTHWMDFRSSLRMNTDESDAELAKVTWPTFCHAWEKLQGLLQDRNMTMLDYHDLYLLRDVALLADIVLNYRQLCFKDSGMEALATPTLPGYTQNHLLLFNTIHYPYPRLTPFFIQLLYKGQEDLYLFYESGVRGGLSIAPGRYAKANNEFCADFDPIQPTSHILYLDMTNLYGKAMCMPLPNGGYRWEVPDGEWTLMDHWKEIGAYADYDDYEGYTYEIDGFFPLGCHDMLSQLPPLPHSQRINQTMTSPFYQAQMNRYGLKHDKRTPKLLASLLRRENYIVDYRVLQQACELGFQVTKVHRVCRYVQSRWCEAYVMHNTNHRKAAKSEEEKAYWKLKVNAGYGKMVQDNRKHMKIKMKMNGDNDDTDHQTIGKIEDWEVMNDEFSILKQKPETVNMNSPVPVGFTILEWSKWLMYDFYYKKLYPVFGDRMRLLFMDTDSLCIHFTSEAPYTEMLEHDLLKHFDMSDFPKDHSYYHYSLFDVANKKVPGTMKDEMAGEQAYIQEVVAMKSKMYSVLKHDQSQKATAKGVPEDIKRKVLNHNQYLDALFQRGNYDSTLPKVITHNIRSELNTMTIRKMSKMTLNPCDSKCYMFDQTHTLPYGHYKVLEALAISDPFAS